LRAVKPEILYKANLPLTYVPVHEFFVTFS
jgi:hypothetical protein